MTEDINEINEVELEKTIESDNTIRKYLSGEEFTDNILGFDIKPVTLASLAFMQEAGSKLTSVTDIDEIENLVLEILIFLYIHTEDHKVLSGIICKSENPKAELRQKSFDMGVDIAPNQIQKILDQIVEMLADATSTKVEPLPKEDDGSKKKVDTQTQQ